MSSSLSINVFARFDQDLYPVCPSLQIPSPLSIAAPIHHIPHSPSYHITLHPPPQAHSHLAVPRPQENKEINLQQTSPQQSEPAYYPATSTPRTPCAHIPWALGRSAGTARSGSWVAFCGSDRASWYGRRWGVWCSGEYWLLVMMAMLELGVGLGNGEKLWIGV